ncbi:MAG: hypothetical protein M1339_01060 [Bacteroidetes bacterium]|nr:hypothetical protein [Bacteroidota bacterium]
MRNSIFLFLLFFIASDLFACTDAQVAKPVIGQPNVFLDCNVCDFNYIRTHVKFVNYVRNRDEAQVQVLVTTMPTGSGGTQYTLVFLGRRSFTGMDDTLHYVSKPLQSWDKTREGMANTLSLGLVRYADQTPIGKYLSVSVSKADSDTIVKDRWNHWVFSVSANGYLNGQSLTSQNSWSGNVSASRTTSQSKFLFSAGTGYSESSYIASGQDVIAISRNHNLRAMGALSMGDHWSAGGIVSSTSSTYNNEKTAISLSPEVEYDIFPYSQSTMRQLRFRYELSYDYYKYYTETIFSKFSDHLTSQGLSVILNLTQPWGSINASLNGANYFYNFTKNHLQFYTQLSLSLSQGLSLNLSGAVSMIHDQLSLPQSAATTDQILLQQTELATQYSYWTAFGVSYTFGSIYNDVVNPRLW